jgi:ATP-grasp domain/ATP-grasp N-terminal domain
MRPRVLLIQQNTLVPFIFEAAERDGIDLVLAHDRTRIPPKGLPAVVDALELDMVDNRGQALAAVRTAHRQNSFDGAITLYDPLVEFTAAVTTELELPGIGIDVARRARDKYAQRASLAAAKLPTPFFSRFGDIENLSELPYPVVAKPANGFNSQGVSRADDPEQLTAAVQLIREINAEKLDRFAPDGAPFDVLIEQFIGGQELCVESLTVDGHTHVLAIAYKGADQGPHFEEGTYITPPHLTNQLQDSIATAVRDWHRALDITFGPTHTELRLDDQQRPILLEMGARIGGSGVVHFMVEQSSGVDFARATLQQATGRLDHFEVGERRERTAANWIVPLGGSGIYEGLAGLQEVQAHPATRRILPLLQPGATIPAFPRFEGFPAFVLSSHDSFDDCVAYQRWVGETLQSQWATP